MKLTDEQINALSDDDVNSMVTWSVNNLCDGWCESDDKTVYFHCGTTGDGYYSVKIEDYCNDPAVMIPIVFQQKINLISPVRDRWSASWNDGGGKWSIDEFSFHHENPLRAAAIVYLKSKRAL